MSTIVAELQPVIESHFVWSKYPTTERAYPTTQLTHEPSPSLTQTTWVHPNHIVSMETVLNPLSINKLSADIGGESVLDEQTSSLARLQEMVTHWSTEVN